MFRRRALFALQVAATVFLMVSLAAADSRARIVRLSYLEGDVQIERGDSRGSERAILNTPVVHGDRLSTPGNASAEVEFEAGSTVRLTPGSAISFRELSLRDSGRRLSVLELEEGEAYFDIDKKEGDFIVAVGRQEFSVRKSARFRVVLDRDQVRGTRNCGSSASSSCRLVVPVRGMPRMNTGATIGWSAISGCCRKISTNCSRWRNSRSRSWRAITRPSAVRSASCSSEAHKRASGWRK